ncbi:hypothetical protein BB561_001206 [Smittium simulii]|uniref:DNA polymerase delta subunit 3 n=1 Tax=Smittium simulii TaxID=133385 RepID=A0A2T9YVN2_9FUNG|nr:hypothetical protein BB561_001206 [Smittium simulii]
MSKIHEYLTNHVFKNNEPLTIREIIREFPDKPDYLQKEFEKFYQESQNECNGVYLASGFVQAPEQHSESYPHKVEVYKLKFCNSSSLDNSEFTKPEINLYCIEKISAAEKTTQDIKESNLSLFKKLPNLKIEDYELEKMIRTSGIKVKNNSNIFDKSTVATKTTHLDSETSIIETQTKKIKKEDNSSKQKLSYSQKKSVDPKPDDNLFSKKSSILKLKSTEPKKEQKEQKEQREQKKQKVTISIDDNCDDDNIIEISSEPPKNKVESSAKNKIKAENVEDKDLVPQSKKKSIKKIVINDCDEDSDEEIKPADLGNAKPKSLEPTKVTVFTSDSDTEMVDKSQTKRVRRKRKVTKTQHFKNTRGMLVSRTYDEWESYSEEEQVKPIHNDKKRGLSEKTFIDNKSNTDSTNNSKPSNTSQKAKPNQSSLMSFFGKK